MLEGKTLLIGVGAQKAGTTWLARYFDEHPDVFMAPFKELDYFSGRRLGFVNTDRRIVERMTTMAIKIYRSHDRRFVHQMPIFECAKERVRMAADPERYLEYFDANTCNGKVACEISPTYALLGPSDFAAMSALCACVKFIFIMRNPIDRCWSQLRFDQRRIRQRGEKSNSPEDMAPTLLEPKYLKFSNYPQTINALRQSVKPENTFFAFYEELFNEDTIASICRFLGVSNHPARLDARFNVSPGAEMPAECRAEVYRSLRFVYTSVQELMGRLPREWEADIEAYDSA